NLSPKCMAAYLQIPRFGSVNNHPRQPSRLSSEVAGLPNQQHDIVQQSFLTDNLVPQNLTIPSVKYPNNHSQQSLKENKLPNIEIIVADINKFEHMKNYKSLLKKISRWMKEDGLLFVHLFCHKTFPYHFE
ncbi:hypothetical protein ACJX0J_009391, partial [Zea mays]